MLQLLYSMPTLKQLNQGTEMKTLVIDNCHIVILTAPEAGENKYVTLNGNAQSSVYSAYVQTAYKAQEVLAIAKEKFGQLKPVLHVGSITLDVVAVPDEPVYDSPLLN